MSALNHHLQGLPQRIIKITFKRNNIIVNIVNISIRNQDRKLKHPFFRFKNE